MSEAWTTLRALRGRSFAAYWAAQTMSLVGDYGFWVAISIELAAVKHRPGLLAVVLGVNVACQIAFILAGGAAADRFGARRGVIAGDAVRALAVALFAVAFASGRDSPAVYVALAVAVGCGDAVFSPAYGVIVPDLVDEHTLTSANSLRLAGEVAAAAVGPLLAGAASAAGALTWLFSADAATFAIGAAVASVIAPRPHAPSAREASEASFVGEVLAGLRHAAAVPFVLRGVVILAAITLVVDGPSAVLLPVHASDRHGLDLGVGGFGWLSAARGLGSLVGAGWWGRRETPPGRRARTLGVCYLAWGAGLAVCGGRNGIAALAGIAVVGFGIAGEDVVWYTALQKITPHRMLGRTLAFADASALLPQPASYALAAVTIGVVAAGHVLILAGAATLLVGLAVLAGALPEPRAAPSPRRRL